MDPVSSAPEGKTALLPQLAEQGKEQQLLVNPCSVAVLYGVI
jgi:hypothetical protein